MANLVRRAANAIIRPPRKNYDLSSIPKFLQGDDDDTYIRQPIELTNNRNLKLVGSLYYSTGMSTTSGGPCVIYLHGNASSQLEGQFLVPNLCRYGIYVFCFDFAGCGCSEGKYVSLGFYEKEDTEFIIDHLHSQFNLSPFILWGRSMGAATALLIDKPLILARVSDSSFTSVSDMCSAIATSMHFPPLFIQASLWFLKKQVIKRAKFDFNDVSPISKSRENEIPCLFGHSEYDQFIPFEQCQRLYGHYQTREKYIMALDGGHNSKRSDEWIRFGVCFIFENFGLNIQNPVISSCRRLQEKIFHFSSFSAMMEASEANELNQDDNDIDLAMMEEDEKDKNNELVEAKKRKKDKNKKNKNKNKRNSINRLSGSFIISESNKKKKRKSLRLKKLSLKHHHKKHKKHHNHQYEEEEEENENENELNKDNKIDSEIDLPNDNKDQKINENKASKDKKVTNYNKFILGDESSSEKLNENENDQSNQNQDSKLIPNENKNETPKDKKVTNYNKFILGDESSSEKLDENENENSNRNQDSKLIPNENKQMSSDKKEIGEDDSPIKIANYNKFILGLNSSSDLLVESKNEQNNDHPKEPNKPPINYNKFVLGLNSSSDQLIENEQNEKESQRSNISPEEPNKALLNYNKFVLGLNSSSDQLIENENQKSNE